MPLPRRLPAALVAGLALLGGTLVAAPAHAADAQRATLTRWTTKADLGKGTRDAVAVSGGTVKLASPKKTYTKNKKTYAYGSWTSPWVSTGFDARTLIPSWAAKTPSGTWVRVQARVRTAKTTGSWDTVADYALATTSLARTSGGTQSDDVASLATDTVTMDGSGRFRSWQVKVLLFTPKGSKATPVLDSVNGVAAGYATRTRSTSATTMTKDVELAVPYSSQMIHRGHQGGRWGAGGEAWCSPTSVSMLLRYWKTGPTKADYAWTGESQGYVDHAARYTYDAAYRGTGNWPFNTSYAASWGVDSFVTRLYDLREAEAFVKAGIPLVTSVAFPRGGLTGAPISSTPGHLMVVRGFTRSGKVIANDPAGSASTKAQIRRVYDRKQFEKAWLGGSGGVVYVLRPTDRKLPTDTPRW